MGASNQSQKRASVDALLDRASSEPAFRERLATEASELTRIGNDFRIRHSETFKIPLTDPDQVDYLFQRMFSLICFLLKKSGRTPVG
jgi:hypothetical protein